MGARTGFTLALLLVLTVVGSRRDFVDSSRLSRAIHSDRVRSLYRSKSPKFRDSDVGAPLQELARLDGGEPAAGSRAFHCALRTHHKRDSAVSPPSICSR